MLQVANISIREYLLLEDTSIYDVFFETLNPKDTFSGFKAKLKNLTFDEVEVIRKIYNKPDFENLKDVFIHVFKLGNYNVSPEDMFLNESIFNFFKANLYIRNYLLKLATQEKKLLSGEPDVKMEMIDGYNSLAPINHLLTKINLANLFSTTPKKIGEWKYNEIFTILVAQNRKAIVDKAYNEIK